MERGSERAMKEMVSGLLNGLLLLVNMGACAHRKASERETGDRVGGGEKVEDPKT